jgi:hypothetical protein
MNAILNAAILFSNNNPPQDLQFDLDDFDNVNAPPAIEPVLGPALTFADQVPVEEDTIQEIFRQSANPSMNDRYFIYTDAHLRRILVITTQQLSILNVNWHT